MSPFTCSLFAGYSLELLNQWIQLLRNNRFNKAGQFVKLAGVSYGVQRPWRVNEACDTVICWGRTYFVIWVLQTACSRHPERCCFQSMLYQYQMLMEIIFSDISNMQTTWELCRVCLESVAVCLLARDFLDLRLLEDRGCTDRVSNFHWIYCLLIWLPDNFNAFRLICKLSEWTKIR